MSTSLFLILFIAPTLEKLAVNQTEPDVRTFLNLVGQKIPHKWKDLGAYLGIPLNIIDMIAHSKGPTDTAFCQCLSAVFEYWRDHQTDKDPSWSDLVSAVKNLDENLAREMISKLTGSTFQM